MPDMNEKAETQQEYFGVRTEDKRNVLRLAKDGEGTCLDCEWGTCLFGGSKGAVCLHTGKKNINELTRCDEYSQSKE